MKVLDVIVTILLVIGALNWGFIGFTGINLIGAIFGEAAVLTRFIYSVVGICGLYEAYNFTAGYEEMHHRWCDMPSPVMH